MLHARMGKRAASCSSRWPYLTDTIACSAMHSSITAANKHRDGVILVDTGASAAAVNSLPRWHPYFRNAVRFDIEPDDEAGPQLRAIGIGPGDVRRVVLTHLRIDHDGGLAAFPTSEILASPASVGARQGSPAG
jgi:N-acyl homoserine lactone hydrolase